MTASTILRLSLSIAFDNSNSWPPPASRPPPLPSGNDRFLRAAAGWCRREVDVVDRVRGRDSWAESGPPALAMQTVCMSKSARKIGNRGAWADGNEEESGEKR